MDSEILEQLAMAYLRIAGLIVETEILLELSEAGEQAIETHLDNCEFCRNNVQIFESMDTGVTGLLTGEENKTAIQIAILVFLVQQEIIRISPPEAGQVIRNLLFENSTSGILMDFTRPCIFSSVEGNDDVS